MSLTYMSSDGELPVPTQAGGVNLELLTRISLLEQRLSAVEQHATDETYGIVKLSNSESITNSEGIALPASEKNASIDGTIANGIEKLQTNILSDRILRIYSGSIFDFSKTDHVSGIYRLGGDGTYINPPKSINANYSFVLVGHHGGDTIFMCVFLYYDEKILFKVGSSITWNSRNWNAISGTQLT